MRWAQPGGVTPDFSSPVTKMDRARRARSNSVTRVRARGDGSCFHCGMATSRQRASELVAISPLRDWSCVACGGGGGLLVMDDQGPLCLDCADMGHLVFLPRGDAALTRRARKTSGLSAVVVRFSRTRKRYERQGVLVEEAALEQAESECLADAEARARRRERARTQRAADDARFEAELTREIRRLYTGCSARRAQQIARHAAVRGSGRVGRSAAARALDADAIALAVAASVRHVDTSYDELLMCGVSRAEARERVLPEVREVLSRWRSAAGTPENPSFLGATLRRRA